ncbi:MAG: hypothetical protein ACLFT3_08335 [Cyclobacteriaceae bacterium]
MKKLSISLFTSFLLIFGACDPERSTTFIVDNQTDIDATMQVYPNSLDQTYDLPSKEKTAIIHVEDDPGDGPSPIFIKEIVDSVEVIFDNERHITYYPDSSSLPSNKTIYNHAYYEENKDGTHFNLTFAITEEDLANAQN